MTDEMVLNLGAEVIQVIMYLAGPMLIAAMVMGIVVSILQAITQINEATLTFIPKMFAVVIILAVMAPWMLRVLKDFTTNTILNASEWIK